MTLTSPHSPPDPPPPASAPTEGRSGEASVVAEGPAPAGRPRRRARARALAVCYVGRRKTSGGAESETALLGGTRRRRRRRRRQRSGRLGTPLVVALGRPAPVAAAALGQAEEGPTARGLLGVSRLVHSPPRPAPAPPAPDARGPRPRGGRDPAGCPGNPAPTPASSDSSSPLLREAPASLRRRRNRAASLGTSPPRRRPGSALKPLSAPKSMDRWDIHTGVSVGGMRTAE